MYGTKAHESLTAFEQAKDKVADMYVEFPCGSTDSEPYIAPCEVLKRIPGWTKVVLSGMPPYQRLSWAQWVRDTQLLTPEEVE
jgi:hypothetical protein